MTLLVMAHRDVELERLTPAQRAIARRLRRVAAIVAAAGLPAEYRPAAFRALAGAELAELEDDDDAASSAGAVPLAA
jgi:hypothetical protein